jgi:hypothetical protein
MNIQSIIKELNAFRITAKDEDEALERIRELTYLINKNKEGYLACEALINVLERHPAADFGGPGDIVHLLENYPGKYESFLYESLERSPAPYTLMLYNRIINAMRKSKKKQEFIDRYKIMAKHPKADKPTRQAALEYYQYQTGSVNAKK